MRHLTCNCLRARRAYASGIHLIMLFFDRKESKIDSLFRIASLRVEEMFELLYEAHNFDYLTHLTWKTHVNVYRIGLLSKGITSTDGEFQVNPANLSCGWKRFDKSTSYNLCSTVRRFQIPGFSCTSAFPIKDFPRLKTILITLPTISLKKETRTRERRREFPAL